MDPEATEEEEEKDEEKKKKDEEKKNEEKRNSVLVGWDILCLYRHSLLAADKTFQVEELVFFFSLGYQLFSQVQIFLRCFSPLKHIMSQTHVQAHCRFPICVNKNSNRDKEGEGQLCHFFIHIYIIITDAGVTL